MKKLIIFIGLLWAACANAQFTPGQLLTAGELNAQFALYSKLAGATFTGPVTIPALTVTTTATLPSQAANTLLGNSSGSSASPTAVSVSNCSGASSALNYLGGSGFSCNGSINALTLSGNTFQSPGPIGSVSPSTASFTNLTANGTLTFSNGSVTLPYLATEAANTVVANFTGSTASPVAFSMPSCTGSSNALGYTSGTGIVCNGSINAATLGGATFASPPAAGYGSSIPEPVAATTISATGLITPSTTSGIKGTTVADNANAGSLGEYTTATASGVSLTTSTTTNITSITLTAGDWDVTGAASVQGAGGANITNLVGGISTTSGTISGLGTYFQLLSAGVGSNSGFIGALPVVRVNSGSVTVYCVSQAVFSSGTATGSCFLRARRVR